MRCTVGVRPQEQGEGDSVVAALAGASGALAAALDIQRAFDCERWPEGASLKLRVALHTAEAQLRDESNYFGQAVGHRWKHSPDICGRGVHYLFSITASTCWPPACSSPMRCCVPARP